MVECQKGVLAESVCLLCCLSPRRNCEYKRGVLAKSTASVYCKRSNVDLSFPALHIFGIIIYRLSWRTEARTRSKKTNHILETHTAWCTPTNNIPWSLHRSISVYECCLRRCFFMFTWYLESGWCGWFASIESQWSSITGFANTYHLASAKDVGTSAGLLLLRPVSTTWCKPNGTFHLLHFLKSMKFHRWVISSTP